MSTAFDAMFAASASPLLDQQFGEAVTITRGTDSTTGVTASWVAQSQPVDAIDGIATVMPDREWLIKKTRYLINATATTPRRADRITDAAGNIYEILPESSSLKTVETTDDAEYWSIKTKRIT